jgi:hypothetical protein
MLVFGVEVRGRYTFLGTVNAGVNKKTSSFLKDIAMKFIQDETFHVGFGSTIIAYCVDGAYSCTKSASMLEKDHHIIAVRCQLHAVSLLLKKVLSIPYLKEFMKQVQDVTDLFLSNGRLRCLLKVHSLGRSLKRLIPVRCASHVIALRQLASLKGALKLAVEDPIFNEYIADQEAPKQRKCEHVRTVVDDKVFWLNVNFCIESLTAVVIVMRHFDRSTSMTGYVRYLWSLLSESVAVSFGKSVSEHVDVITKQEILNTVEDTFLGECSHVFDAAYVLNPHFLTDVRRLARSRNEMDIGEWSDLKESTVSVLTTLISRDLIVRGQEQQQLSVISKVTSELMEYYLQSGSFASVHTVDAAVDVELLWESIGENTTLKSYAIMILNIAHSVSNVERNHKVTSLIHSSRRASLGCAMVDTLTRGNLSIRNSDVAAPAKFSLQDVTLLTALSHDDLLSLEQWAEMQQLALLKTKQTIEIDGSGEALHGASGETLTSFSEPTGDADWVQEDHFEEEEIISVEPRKSSRGRSIIPPKRFRDAILQTK